MERISWLFVGEKQTFYDNHDNPSAPMESFEWFYLETYAREKSSVKCKEIEKSTFNLNIFFFKTLEKIQIFYFR